MNTQYLKTRLSESIDAFIASENDRIEACKATCGDHGFRENHLKYAEILRANVAAAESFDALFDAFMLHSAAAGLPGGGPKGSDYDGVIVPEDTLNGCDGNNSAGSIFAAAFLEYNNGEKFSDWINSLDPRDVDWYADGKACWMFQNCVMEINNHFCTHIKYANIIMCSRVAGAYHLQGADRGGELVKVFMAKYPQLTAQ